MDTNETFTNDADNELDIFKNRRFILNKEEIKDFFNDIVQVCNVHGNESRQSDSNFDAPYGVYSNLCTGCNGGTQNGVRRCSFQRMAHYLNKWLTKLIGDHKILKIEFVCTMMVI